MHQAETLEETDFLLTVTAGTVLLSDVRFLDGSWREALRMAAVVHPHVASIVVAEDAEHPSLSDAYSVGACAVLRKPIVLDQAIERIRVLDEAARDRAALLCNPT
jgi:DNA-binding NtrC family response regulator